MRQKAWQNFAHIHCAVCTSTLTVMPQLTSKPDIPITYFATCLFHTRLSNYIQYIIFIHKVLASMVNYVFHTILSKYVYNMFTKYEHGSTEGHLHVRLTKITGNECVENFL